MQMYIYRIAKFYTITVVVCIAFYSCSPRFSPEIEQSLRMAGRNRSELGKVLKHYEKNPADSLKLRAAEYLIAYMPGHYSYVGDDIHRFYAEIDSLLDIDFMGTDIVSEAERISLKYPGLMQNLVEDIRVVTADFLIRNIDSAFALWREKPWAEHLTFEQFCEYLLPYKSAELQELDGWRDTLAESFGRGLARQLPNDQYHYSVHYAASAVTWDLKAKLPLISTDEYRGYSLSNASAMRRIVLGNCVVVANQLASIFRAQGIPAVVDRAPVWGRRDGRHAFCSIVDERGNFLPLMWGFDFESGTSFSAMSAAPKILRSTYKPDERTLEYYRETTYPERLFSVFETDVTDQYVATKDLAIPVSTKGVKGRYAYIAVFNHRQWVMIDFGELRGRKARFKKMATDHVYLTFGYDGNSLVPISDPFIVRSDGSLEIRTPDTDNPLTLSLTRKYPKRLDIASYETRMKGGKIQASTRDDFADAVTLVTYDTMPFPDTVMLNAPQPYRYWRYLSSANSSGNVAEVELYVQGTESAARGAVIGTSGSYGNNPSRTREAAFDGDELTFFDSPIVDYSWVGLDFSVPVTVDRVRCIPRNDDNYIRIGDEYELFYWGGGCWTSLGRRIARERVLHYDNVPSGALLWLRNHTRGNEERIFTIENGKQRWW